MLKRLTIEIFVAMLIGAVLGLFGPFGTYAMAIGLRIFYWAAFLLLGYVLFRPVLIVSEWFAGQTGVSIWLANGLGIGLASLPMTLIVTWMLNGFQFKVALLSSDLPITYGQVLLVSFIVNSIYRALFQKPKAIPAAPLSAKATAPETSVGTNHLQLQPQFQSRLPNGFGTVLALHGEDHYVRVFGSARDILILIRLRDAIEEMSTVDGLQIHRSWWVAREAMTSSERSGRSYTLALANGIKIPASREGKKLLEKHRWV